MATWTLGHWHCISSRADCRSIEPTGALCRPFSVVVRLLEAAQWALGCTSAVGINDALSRLIAALAVSDCSSLLQLLTALAVLSASSRRHTQLPLSAAT